MSPFETTFIYGLRHPVTGAVRYVGKSDKPEVRAYLHRWDAEKRPSRRLHSWIKALQKEGLEPELFIIEECRRERWKERERYWIAFYGRAALVNHTDGGEGLDNPSPEVRAKMSAKQKGREWSPEVIASRIRYGEENGFFGKHHSDETREKISAAKTGQPSAKKGKPAPETCWRGRLKTYILTDPDGKEHVVIHLSKFCEEHNLNRGNLLGTLSGRGKRVKGWTIRRAEEDKSTGVTAV